MDGYVCHSWCRGERCRCKRGVRRLRTDSPLTLYFSGLNGGNDRIYPARRVLLRPIPSVMLQSQETEWTIYSCSVKKVGWDPPPR